MTAMDEFVQWMQSLGIPTKAEACRKLQIGQQQLYTTVKGDKMPPSLRMKMLLLAMVKHSEGRWAELNDIARTPVDWCKYAEQERCKAERNTALDVLYTKMSASVVPGSAQGGGCVYEHARNK